MKNIITIISFAALLSSYSAFAENKVVVIPMAGDAAAPGIAQFNGGNQQFVLASADSVVRSVSIDAPSAGTVIVNASGYVRPTAGVSTFRCTISTTNSINFGYLIFLQDVPDGVGAPFAGTRGFDVDSGLNTFNLVCDVIGAGEVIDSNITAMFFPG